MKIDCGDKAVPYSLIFSRSNVLDEFDTTVISRLIETIDISLLSLNEGAHHQLDDSLLRNLNSSLKYLYHHYPFISIIFKKTVQGHDHCEITITALPLDSRLYKKISQKWSYDLSSWVQLAIFQPSKFVGLLERYFPQVFHSNIASSTNSHRQI